MFTLDAESDSASWCDLRVLSVFSGKQTRDRRFLLNRRELFLKNCQDSVGVAFKIIWKTRKIIQFSTTIQLSNSKTKEISRKIEKKIS